jgi:nucleoid-associated protein YgaU
MFGQPRTISKRRRGARAQQPSLDAIYTVQPEDVGGGLMEIARRLYGRAERWMAIYEANLHVIGANPNVLRAGQQLAILGLPSGGQRQGSAAIYVVQPADLLDGLPGIALRLWGSAELWPRLYAVNRGVVGESPDSLQPGQRLLVIAP